MESESPSMSEFVPNPTTLMPIETCTTSTERRRSTPPLVDNFAISVLGTLSRILNPLAFMSLQGKRNLANPDMRGLRLAINDYLIGIQPPSVTIAKSSDDMVSSLITLGTSSSFADLYVRRLDDICRTLGIPDLYLTHSPHYWIAGVLKATCQGEQGTSGGGSMTNSSSEMNKESTGSSEPNLHSSNQKSYDKEAGDSPPKAPRTATRIEADELHAYTQTSIFGLPRTVSVIEMENIMKDSSHKPLDLDLFRQFSSVSNIKFLETTKISVFHGCALPTSTSILTYGEFSRAFSFTPTHLTTLPSIYFSNSARYALLWGYLKSVNFATLATPLEALTAAVYQVDLDLRDIPYVTFVSQQSIRKFITDNMTRSVTAQPGVIVGPFHPSHVVELKGQAVARNDANTCDTPSQPADSPMPQRTHEPHVTSAQEPPAATKVESSNASTEQVSARSTLLNPSTLENDESTPTIRPDFEWETVHESLRSSSVVANYLDPDELLQLAVSSKTGETWVNKGAITVYHVVPSINEESRNVDAPTSA